MTYNIHPLFVHFPIAFLFVFSIIKILPLKTWFPKIAWKDIERAMLLVGVLGAFAALQTGETAEHLVTPNHQLVEMHSTFADIATWIFAGLLVGEIVTILNSYEAKLDKKFKYVLKITHFLERILSNRGVSVTLVGLGLISIMITGLLGGLMVYGLSSDPLAPIVLKILGIAL
jgi:uncharacterized membrane protein